ncbi:LytTR family DNA-binding domain-containing protein [Rapidithrix thailandica]|uniref:LytTR family DNA-binding domain-containing protein n=1 Tax=Rapidithrix thailandica TaxID=413964 RepID=A0AAW9S2X0_9BACT
MMKVRCLAVDDEALALTLIENYIQKMPQLELVAKCQKPLEVVEILQKDSVDLVFLDIQMPQLTGVELLQSLSQPPLVIFTTAYADFALEGYQLGVIDYLVKPFSFERFAKAVNKATEQLHLRQLSQQVTENSLTSLPKFLTVKSEHKIYKIDLRDILYIEGLKEYVSIYTQDQRIITLESLKKLEEILPADQFIRIHKSYIIAFKQVRSIEGNMVELAGKQLPIGKTYRQVVIKKLLEDS